MQLKEFKKDKDNKVKEIKKMTVEGTKKDKEFEKLMKSCDILEARVDILEHIENELKEKVHILEAIAGDLNEEEKSIIMIQKEEKKEEQNAIKEKEYEKRKIEELNKKNSRVMDQLADTKKELVKISRYQDLSK